MTPWTPELIDRLRKLWRADTPLEDMALAFDGQFSRLAIRHKAKRLGERSRPQQRPKGSPGLPKRSDAPHDWRHAKQIAEYTGAPDPYLPTVEGNAAHVAAVMRASGDCGFSAINLARRS